MSNLSALLDETEQFYRRFVVMTDAQFVAITLWTAHTHAIDAAEATPYVNPSSPAKKAGKTRLLDVAALLVREPLSTGGASEAALFRSIGADITPTLLWDEVDTVFGKQSSENEGKRGILDNGYTRNKPYLRCVGEGKNQTVEKFQVFCPKMLCGIGSLPDTVADRSIPIRLKRKTRAEQVERFRERSAKLEAEPLRQRLEAWADESLDALVDARPFLPDELDDRAQDVCEPLLAIAEHAGGKWPKRTRDALVALRSDQVEDEEAIGVRLLVDIREVSVQRLEMTTVELLTAIFSVESSPWADWWGETHRDKDGDTSVVPSRGGAMKLARALRPFGVRPRTLGGRAKGYHMADFEDVFGRYLSPAETVPPPSTDIEVVQVVQTQQASQESAVSRSSRDDSLDDLEMPADGSTTPSGRPGRPETPEGGAGGKNDRPLSGDNAAMCVVCDAPFVWGENGSAAVNCPSCVTRREATA